MKLFIKLNELGVQLTVENGELNLKAPRGVLTPDIISEIKTHKSDLIALLSYSDESIPKAEKQTSYPLSSAQKRMWLLYQLDKKSSVYNIVSYISLKGNYNVEALKLALHETVKKHETLRTVFKVNEENEVRQYILDASQFNSSLDFKDFSNVDEDTNWSVYLDGKLNSYFDLENGPLFHAHFLKIAADEYVFCLNMHHIISDGRSIEVFKEDVFTFYETLTHQQEIESKPLGIQYKDYVIWQETQKEKTAYKEDKSYWLNQFKTTPSIIDLPNQKKRPKIKSFNGRLLNYNFSKETSNQTFQFFNEKKVTLFVGLLTALKSCIHLYTSEEDIVLGTPVAGRTHEDLKDQIGCYINTLAIRNEVSPNTSFNELLLSVKETMLESLVHQSYAFDELLHELNLQRDKARNPLFDIFISLENEDVSQNKNIEPGSKYNAAFDEINMACKFDIEFMFFHSENSLSLGVNYNSDVYQKETILGFIKHFDALLNSVVNQPDVRIAEIDLFSDDQKSELQLKGTKHTISRKFGDLFSTIVEKHTKDIAVKHKDKELSYLELDEQSNQFAQYLRTEKKISKGDLVAVMLTKDEFLITAMLAIWKLGAVYVPVDTESPSSRISFIMEDCNSKLLLNDELKNGYLAQETAQDKNPLASEINDDDLAYVIYTSGSTGKPKGVQVTHANLNHFANFLHEYYQDFDKVVQPLIASHAFDISLFQIVSPLLSGGTVIVLQKEQMQNISSVIEIIKESTVIDTVPAFYELIVSHINEQNLTGFSNIKKVFIGGDKVSDAILKKLSKVFASAEISNTYGPTEGTIFCLEKKYPAGTIDETTAGSIIGSPIMNAEICILNSYDKLVPKGVTGEICIAGLGVSKGYLNRPDLTQEKFISHPYQADKKLYKTGDLGRLLDNGLIEFAGRNDNQVKIRGYRIELGEIEHCLLKITKAKEVLVRLVKTEQDTEILVAYIVGNTDIAIDAISEKLAVELPDYMIPQSYIALEKMPLNHNGKVDIKKLPIPALQENTTDRSNAKAPEDEIGIQLANIWKGILDVDFVSVDDDFFALGGQSLKIMHLSGQINGVFNQTLAYKDLFLNSKFSDQAKLINTALAEEKDNFTNVPESGPYDPFPLTNLQMAYYVGREDGLELSTSSHILLENQLLDLDLDRFQDSLTKVIKRHEALRTIYDTEGKQRVLPFEDSMTKAFEFIDLSQEDNQFEKLEEARKKIFEQRLHLEIWPCFKIVVLQLKEEFHLLALVDAIVADNSSLNIIVEDFQRFYKGEDLAPLNFTFKQYIEELEKKKQSSAFTEAQNYWESRIEDLPLGPQLTLKTKASEIKSPTYSNHFHPFPPGSWEKLKNIGLKHKVSPTILLITAFSETLVKWTSNPNFLLNLTLFNRLPFHPDVMKVVGDFTDLLLLEVHQNSSKSFIEKAVALNQQFLNDMNHNLISGVEINKELAKREGLLGTLVTPVVVTSILEDGGTEDEQAEVYKVLTNPDRKEDFVRTSQVWLDHQLILVQGLLCINWTVVKELFPAGMIEDMFTDYISRLQYLLELTNTASFEDTLPAHQLTQLEAYNSTENKSLLEDENLIDGFLAQVAKNPSNEALKQGDKSFSYKELDELSDKVAIWLQTKKLPKETLVAIVSEKSWKQIVAVLGILKAGGAYLPISSSLPVKRINHIIEDGQATCVLTDGNIETHTFHDSLHVFEITEDNIANVEGERKPIKSNQHDVAYVIYTSGTTGNPKGVIINHKGAVNTNRDINLKINLSSDDVVLGVSSLSFDLSVYDIFGTFREGAKLVLPPYSKYPDPQIWKELVLTEGVTVWNSTPALAEIFEKSIALENSNIKENLTLRCYLLSGDWIPVLLPSQLKAYGTKAPEVYSLGGATEASIWSIFHKTDGSEINMTSIPYGKPLQNQKMYVLDTQLMPCPLWVEGDIYIGGEGLSLGYWNDSVKTNAAFITHPIWGDRLYRTGDRGRFTDDLNIEFLGRKDTQIKINGYRVEIGEIENVLNKHEEIQKCVVNAIVSDSKEKILVCYYTANKNIQDSTITTYLKEYLPHYMVPQYFIKMEAIPVTSNGKIDRSKLPIPDITAEEMESLQQAETATEITLETIWKQILGRDEIGMNQSFFEVGGDSLKALRVLIEIEKEFSVRINLEKLFSTPTIGFLSKEIDREVWLSMEDENSTNEISI
ncbi:non-ribosomal peptide synthetase [uncultured Kordia sp.]|uniref:non-ribosomal peptide synthetase n=1 Tax=uncultured Kordia sp. TaxID=507699 RepID=UPI002635D254|nr:non-ribosomal peptide synthetase [uncultured Kordia sp.]